jgi:formamidopyrimidine-DNA glycosylase
VPELPEVERVRRALQPAMAGARFERVHLRRADLRQPFPSGFARRLRGQTVVALTRRGKYLIATLSSGDLLIMHLGMSGSFRIDRERTPRLTRRIDLVDRHDHVVFEMSSGVRVTFNDPRRFGIMDLVSATAAASHASIGKLGPEPLSPQFTAAALARACAGKKVALKVALLDQRIVAGLGNIYASEALNLARLSPRRRASTIATASGEPRETARTLAAAIKAVLRKALAGRSTDMYRATRFRVYDREGSPCPTKDCPGTIRVITQAGRSTFFCPVCQR